jgi:hypothetical protein
MTERDPLNEVLREWHSEEPSREFDERVLLAYRRSRGDFFSRLWRARVSIPVPVLALAAAAVCALVLWLRAPRPTEQIGGPGVVTQLDSTGFRPLPNGEARVVSVKELRQ